MGNRTDSEMTTMPQPLPFPLAIIACLAIGYAWYRLLAWYYGVTR